MTTGIEVLQSLEKSTLGDWLPYKNTIQKIYIELTEHCNLNCHACFRNNWTHAPIHMSEETYNKVLNAATQVETVVIGGIGEPTTHPKFIEYSKLLEKKTLELTSNAFDWAEETLDTIVSCYNKITVSVDGLPKSFASARGFDFAKIAENVRRLNAKKTSVRSKFPLIHAQFVLTTENMYDVTELIPILKQLGFQRLIISNLLPQSEQDQARIVYTTCLSKELRAFVSSWYPVAARNQLPIKIPQTKFESEHRCAFIEKGAVCITANGDVSPCYRFMHEGQEYVFGRKKKIVPVYFGNIKDAMLMDIWNQKDYEVFRFQNYASRYPSCIDCDYVEICDYINTSEADCRANEPSCADCLWCRGLIECP